MGDAVSAADLERQVARLEARCAALLAVNAELAADLAAARDGAARSRGPGGAALHVIDAETEASRLAERVAAADAAVEAAIAERDALAADLAACQPVLESNLARLHEQEERINALQARLDAVEPLLAEQEGALAEADRFRARRGVRAVTWLADRIPRRRR